MQLKFTVGIGIFDSALCEQHLESVTWEIVAPNGDSMEKILEKELKKHYATNYKDLDPFAEFEVLSVCRVDPSTWEPITREIAIV